MFIVEAPDRLAVESLVHEVPGEVVLAAIRNSQDHDAVIVIAKDDDPPAVRHETNVAAELRRR